MYLLPPIPHPSFTFKPLSSSLSSSSSTSTSKAIIIGAGLAGLAAATHLHSRNVPFLLLESSDSVGGRIRTDSLDGFLLDRGFQIFLTAYPEASRLLHYPSLNLRPFYPGALVYSDNSFHRVADPFRRPLDGIASLTNPIGTLPDKILVGLTRILSTLRTDNEILTAGECTISQRLTDVGFSSAIVDKFFKPFLGGIYFDKELSTSSRLYDFVIKCLALGENTVPAGGIGAIPQQLVDRLPKESVRVNCRAAEVELGSTSTVRLESGEVIEAGLGLVVAVDQPEAEKLLPQAFPNRRIKRVRSTVCIYFSADHAAVNDPILVLNGSGQGIVNNMFFATNVAPSYGPNGKVLVSVSLIGTYDDRSDEDLAGEVVKEIGGWFGAEEVKSWKHLRTYRIGFAQPDQTPPTDFVGRDPRICDGVYVCGDYMGSATFDGALVSGRRAAQALIQDRRLL